MLKRLSSFVTLLCAMWLLLHLFSFPAVAQMDRAAISGLVTDTSGAVVAGANVECTNVRTQAIRTTVTTGQGTYNFPLMEVGEYHLAVSAPGLAPKQSTVELSLTGAVSDFHLGVGNTSTKIEVTATASQVQLQTESHNVSEIMGTTQLVQLPNLSRNLINTATLAPASQPGTDTITNAGDVGFFNQQSNSAYIAGLDNYHVLFLQDGVENVNLLNQTANILASVEAAQEVQTDVNNAPARFSHPAVINVITKGGSNQFHGTAYDFLQNDAFNARNWFSQSVPVERYNLFGANLGGPILENKLFFFFDYSGLRNYSHGVFTGRVPTTAERSGNLSGEAPIFDPASFSTATGTTTPFLGNIIPSGRINPFATKWLANYPQPNAPLSASNVNYISTLPSKSTYDEYLGRVDWTISPRNQLIGSIIRATPFSGSTTIVPGLFGINFDDKGLNATVEETMVISPTLVNVAKVGYNRSVVNRTQEGAGAKNYAADYGLIGLNAAPIQWAPPSIGIGNISSFGDPYSPQGAIQNRYQYADEINWTHGKHNMYFGGEFVRTQFYGYWTVNNNGNYSFAGNATGQYARGALVMPGNPFADFLLGLPQSAIAAVGVSADPFRSSAGNVYFQDDWKLLPTLTVNLGLRYDIAQAPYDIKGHGGLFSVALDRVIPGTYNTNFGDWGPRFGFAWAFMPNFVLRGGYGIYYGGNQWENLQFQLLYPPNVIQKSYQFSITNQQPIQTAVSTAPTGGGLISPFTMAKEFKDPSVQEWNLNIQRRLGENTLATIAYLGDVSRHVENRADANQPYALSPGNTSGILDVRPDPNVSFVYIQEGASMANYNALTVSINRRFANGLQFLGSYTWSKSMNLSDGDNWTFADQYNPGVTYAAAGWDRTHNLVISGVYALPFKPVNRFLNEAIGGWTVSGIQKLATGQPVQITAINNRDGSPYVTQFATKVCNPHSGFHQTRFSLFNPSCFVQPGNGQNGLGGRGSAREPRLNTTDISLSKTFRLWREHALEFRAESFGAFNHPNFLTPGIALVGTPGIGEVTGSTGERKGQFALRYSF
jgi:carboxypeptidase family protein/TonB-dependent receptor-like protein